MTGETSHTGMLRTLANDLTRNGWQGVKVENVSSVMDGSNYEGDPVSVVYRVIVGLRQKSVWGITSLRTWLSDA